MEKSIINTGLAISILLLLCISISRIAYPFDYGGYEAGVWAPADLSIHGINPYKISLTLTPPFIMSPYGIVYYLTVGLGINFFGFQFWFARIISVVCVAICAVCLKRLTYKFTGNQLMAMLSPLLFLSQFPLQSFIGVQRPDLLALMLSLAGITMALTIQPEKNIKAILFIVLQAIILLGAVFTRQTSFLPILIVSVWYLFNRLYSQLFIFLLTIVSCIVAILIWLNYMPGNGYIWQQWLLASSVEQSFNMGLGHFIGVTTSPATIGILLLAILIWLSKKSKTSGENVIYSRLLIIYFIFSLALSAITASRMGSNINYYLETTAVIAMIVPFYLSRIKELAVKPKYYLLILIFIVLGTAFTGARICRGEYYRWRALPYFKEIVTVIKSNTPKDEPVYSVYPELAVAGNRQYYFNDFVQYDGRAPEQHKIMNQIINSGRLSAIITSSDITPQGYYRYKLSNPMPYKFYGAYIYLRKSK